MTDSAARKAPAYTYIVSGGGAAGLSLVYHLGLAGLLLDQRVLLIDQVPKTRNDRTWCFWEQGPGPFERVVAHRWRNLWVHGSGRSRRLSIAPYEYKSIQGGDFYRFMNDWLATQPNVTRCLGTVEQIEERDGGVAVTVDGRVCTGLWAFSSIPTATAAVPPGYISWFQHFKGWVITTPQPMFDIDAATFMDFRVPQDNTVHFVYVLPHAANSALIEDTYFSSSLLPQEVYDKGLREYINQQLGLTSYAITHSEYGVIPMTDMPFVRRPSPHVMTIGTAGGMTKASTGYTFQRIQRQSQRIVASLQTTGQPFYAEPLLNRHGFMDSILLNVLDKGRVSGKTFFEELFERNSPQQVLRFLDEDSTLLEDLALMSTVNIPAFLASTLDVLWQRMRHGS